ncbi:MAG: energy transducer TonB [Prevotellaceae bacterium]|jgi:protein TonB|nr:energy transducer TonB [Prevotellaceae bacterium]
MESKKTPKADLQNKKGLFFEIGLAVALAIVLGGFSWTTREKKVSLVADRQEIVEEEEAVPITQQEPPPPQEIPQVQQLSEEIIILDDDVKLDQNLDFSTEDTNKDMLMRMDYVDRKETAREEVVEDEVIPFAIVEEKPKFQGGDANSFTKWVNSKIVYPLSAQENNIQGTVYLSFDVGVDGSLSNIKVIRGVDPLLDQEALRVVKMSPKWTPGRQQNKAVKVSYQFPVKFQLQ